MNKKTDVGRLLQEFQFWMNLEEHLTRVIEGIPGHMSEVFQSLQDLNDEDLPTNTEINEPLLEEKVLPALFDALDITRMIVGVYARKLVKNGAIPGTPNSPQAHPPNGTTRYPNYPTYN